MFALLLAGSLAIGNDSESTSSVVIQEAMTRTTQFPVYRIRIGMTSKEVQETLAEDTELTDCGCNLMGRYRKSKLMVFYDRQTLRVIQRSEWEEEKFPSLSKSWRLSTGIGDD